MQILGQGTELEGLPRQAIKSMESLVSDGPRSIGESVVAKSQESEFEDEDEEPEPLNNVNDLGKGILRTKMNVIYTILLVGETGKGKTSFLSLLANVLKGNDPKQYKFFHDESNEAGGAKAQSQTNSAKLYELTSKNGITVRILDTPGLADTRGIARDEKHKASIAEAIEQSIPIINAVIILANGTEERLGVATDYALTTLSSIFPRTLADNIGIVFTNVASPLSLNFDPDSLPDALRGIQNNQFSLDNPLALWKKFIQFRGQRKMNKIDLESAVKERHTQALQQLVFLFDWLDTLVPRPTKEIINLYKNSQEIEDKIQSALEFALKLADMKNELAKIKESNDGNVITMQLYENLQRATRQVWEQVDSDTLNMICRHPQCHVNCIIGVEPESLHPVFSFFRSNATQAPPPRGICKCGHPDESHSLRRSLWKKRDTNWVIDEDAEKKYDEAKRRDDENRKIMVDIASIIASLGKKMKQELALVGRLVESYASLSLAGSFAGQVTKAVKYMEMNLEAMRNNTSNPELVQMVEESLETMKLKLKMVEEASQKAERRVVRVQGNKGIARCIT
ncbi:hypothetical protein F5887DRAFT_1132409 [Amanita rubescens]|nr:hypothetical protein F5887DRAFT_1132409 [Amanita rubescens]